MLDQDRRQLGQLLDLMTDRIADWLASVVREHCNYYAVPSNSDAIIAFRTQATRHWCHALRRRSQRSSPDWERMDRLANRSLPPARVTHPTPM